MALLKGRGGARKGQWRERRHRRRQFYSLLLQHQHGGQDTILARLRAATATRGVDWLKRQVGALILDEEGSWTVEETHHVRRSRPPACFSPGPPSRPARQTGSPRGDRSAPPAKRTQRQDNSGPGRSARRRPTPGGGATGRYGAASPPEFHRPQSEGLTHGGGRTGRGAKGGSSEDTVATGGGLERSARLWVGGA